MSEYGEIAGPQGAIMLEHKRGSWMAHSFQLAGIDHEPFEPLFRLADEELLQHGAVRRYVTTRPGYPCRISLQDAEIGEELLLLPYEHQPAASPYRASGPIYVRRGAKVGSPGTELEFAL